jgi:hypothetical protein
MRCWVLTIIDEQNFGCKNPWCLESLIKTIQLNLNMGDLKIFQSKKIRSEWNEKENKWYFSVQDVVEILTDSVDVKQYIKKMLSRDEQLKINWGTICTLVEMDYSILTAEISKATFGLTPSEYKKVKGLKSQNLRDHMNDLELIFSMLGEASTTAIVKKVGAPQRIVSN